MDIVALASTTAAPRAAASQTESGDGRSPNEVPRMHVSIGRLRLKPDGNRVRFLWHGALAYLQAKRAPGIIRASVYREDSRTLWSLSVWSSSEAMLAYRNSGSHLRVMKISQALGARVDFRHWQADAVPSWEEAMSRLTDSEDRQQPEP